LNEINNQEDITEQVQAILEERGKKALEMAQGNKAKASKVLNIPRSTLYYKMELYKIK